MTEFKRKDLLTGELFVAKRVDQHFICRKNQIKYNNEKAKKKRNKIHSCNKPIGWYRSVVKKTYLILQKLRELRLIEK
jgi:hypothetical protein